MKNQLRVLQQPKIKAETVAPTEVGALFQRATRAKLSKRAQGFRLQPRSLVPHLLHSKLSEAPANHQNEKSLMLKSKSQCQSSIKIKTVINYRHQKVLTKLKADK